MANAPYPEFPGIVSPLPTPGAKRGAIKANGIDYAWQWDAQAKEYRYTIVGPDSANIGGESLWPVTPAQFAQDNGDPTTDKSLNPHPDAGGVLSDSAAIEANGAQLGALTGGRLAGPSGVKKVLDKGTQAVLSPFGWIKELFSAQLWDRILFVLGGVILFLIGVVLILHKQLPTPI